MVTQPGTKLDRLPVSSSTFPWPHFLWGESGGALPEEARTALLALQLGVDAHFPLSWGPSRPTLPAGRHAGCWLHNWGGQSCPLQAAAGTGGPSWGPLGPPLQAAAPGAPSAPRSRRSAGSGPGALQGTSPHLAPAPWGPRGGRQQSHCGVMGAKGPGYLRGVRAGSGTFCRSW